MGCHNATRLGDITEATIWDAWIAALMGPRFGRIALTDMTFWLVFYVLFLYLIGDMANADLLSRGYGLLPRLAGRRRWWVGKLVMLAVLTLLYTAVYFAALLVGAGLRLPTAPIIHHNALGLAHSVQVLPFSVEVFVLVTSTLLSLAVLQWFLSVMWRQSFQAFLAVLCLMTLSLFLGIRHLVPVRWLPGNQSNFCGGEDIN
jgi:hypothetical protein